MILQSLARTILRFASPVTLARPSAPAYNTNGVASTTSTTSTISAHVQRPAGPAELLHLPEGDRVRRTCAVWSLSELRHGDRITLADGETYELQAVGEWSGVAGYYAAVGIKDA